MAPPPMMAPPECRCTSGSAGPTARAGSQPRRRVGSRLPRLPNRWLGIRAEGPRHSFCRLPRGDGCVGGALSGGRGLYPHLTTRGVAGPSLLRRAFLRAERWLAASTAVLGAWVGSANADRHWIATLLGACTTNSSTFFAPGGAGAGGGGGGAARVPPAQPGRGVPGSTGGSVDRWHGVAGEYRF